MIPSIFFVSESILYLNLIAGLVFTFKGGWNPDNFVIPIVSSLADTITTAAIIISLIIIF